MFVEVVLSAGFKSIDAMAQRNLVAVQGKDLRLGEMAFDLDGQHGLLDFAAEMSLG